MMLMPGVTSEPSRQNLGLKAYAAASDAICRHNQRCVDHHGLAGGSGSQHPAHTSSMRIFQAGIREDGCAAHGAVPKKLARPDAE